LFVSPKVIYWGVWLVLNYKVWVFSFKISLKF
jgi:hypothetical protein